MTAIFILAGLLLFPPQQAAAQRSTVPLPDRPGVFAVTDRGVVELTVFGEQRRVEGATPTFLYPASVLDQIPVVLSIKSFYVNMSGWTPKDLYLIAGRKRLGTPRDNYRRLNGRAYSLGPVAFEVVTEQLELVALEKEYRQLTRKKKSGDDVRAYVVIEVSNEAGLSRRSYPIQVDIPPDAAGK